MRLVATSGDQMLSFPLRQGSTLIGRHPSCHVCIPAKGLSRRHCQIYVDGTTAMLRDLGSSNGTFVNSQRVERTQLQDGDVISLGGFQLRFDSEGAMPIGSAYGQGAEATEEVVIPAEPTDAPPTEPAEPFVDPAAPHQGYDEPVDAEFVDAGPGEPVGEAGVPPPTDFPEQPEGDETPVDNAFVPAPYSGGGQSFGVADQPQLVVRDGRWFLRDPKTGREVEIAPTGGAGAVAAQPEAARRPNTKLLLAVIGAAVAVVLIFAFIVFPGDGNGGKGGQGFPIRLYNQLVSAGLEALREAKKAATFEDRKPHFEAALAKFETANEKRPDIYTANYLAQYVRFRIAAEGDMSKFNWREARRALGDIENVFSASKDAISFAKEEVGWIDGEQTALGIAMAALAKLGPDPSDENYKDVYNELAGVPKGYWAYDNLAMPKRLEIRRTLGERHLGRARAAMARRNWEDAIRFSQDAEAWVDDQAAIKKQIALCQRYMRERDLLEEGKQAEQDENYASAKVALKGIPADSPYADEAKSLLARIETKTTRAAREAVLKQAKTLYDNGGGEEASKLIREHDLKELAYIPKRVKQITELIAAGQAAEKAKEFKKAQALYQQATEVEPDANNAYHRRAAALKAELEGRFAQIAADFATEGYTYINTDPRKARQLFNLARQYDPEQPRAIRGRDQLQRQANYLNAQAEQLIKDSEYAVARAKLLKALDYADPASEVYTRIKQKLESLR